MTATRSSTTDSAISSEVEVHGNTLIRHRVNGELVFEYEQPQLDENDADAKKLIKDGQKMLSGGSISPRPRATPAISQSRDQAASVGGL